MPNYKAHLCAPGLWGARSAECFTAVLAELAGLAHLLILPSEHNQLSRGCGHKPSVVAGPGVTLQCRWPPDTHRNVSRGLDSSVGSSGTEGPGGSSSLVAGAQSHSLDQELQTRPSTQPDSAGEAMPGTRPHHSATTATTPLALRLGDTRTGPGCPLLQGHRGASGWQEPHCKNLWALLSWHPGGEGSEGTGLCVSLPLPAPSRSPAARPSPSL